VLAIEFVALALVGYASVSFLSMGNSTLQLATDPQMRGRVMALWSVAFLGSTPIGGPAIGWVTARAGARVGLGVGAASCFVAGALGVLAIRHLRTRAAAREADTAEHTLEHTAGHTPVTSDPGNDTDVGIDLPGHPVAP
jgi:MFS family permease